MFVMVGIAFFTLIPSYTKDCRSIFLKKITKPEDLLYLWKCNLAAEVEKESFKLC